MKNLSYCIVPEDTAHGAAIESLTAEAFGPGRFTRAAFRLREGVSHEMALSFTAFEQDNVVGSVRLTKITIGELEALVLGPLVVAPGLKNNGIGADLMDRAVSTARSAGHRFIILVGDKPYYERFGFDRVPHNQISLPGPVDPTRILYCELQPGCLKDFVGKAERTSVPA